MTVRSQLAWLVVACVLPVWLAAGFLLYHSYQYKRSAIEQHMLGTARALSLTVDGELARVQSALRALATSPLLTSHDFIAFHGQIREVLLEFPDADIILADANGQQLVNSYRPAGAALPKRNVPDAVRRLFETGQPLVTDLFQGAVTKRLLIGVDVPVLRDGKVVYDLSMTLPAERLGAILALQHLSPDWIGSIQDTKGVLAARTRNAAQFVGKPSGPGLQKRMAESAEGAVEIVNLDGVEVFDTFSRSAVSGWVVVIGMPKDALLAEIRQWMWWAIGGAVLLAGLGIGLGTLAAGRIARSIRALVAPALALGHGERVSVGWLDLKEANEVGQALMTASDLLRQRAEQRDEAERALAERTRMLQRHYENLHSLNRIAALPQADAASQLSAALAAGALHLGLEKGIVSHIVGQDLVIEHHYAPTDSGLADGKVIDLGETYCSITVDADAAVAIPYVSRSPYANHPGFRTFGLESYLGTPVKTFGRPYGTVAFLSSAPRLQPFDDRDLEFIDLLARWVGTVLERDLSERELRAARVVAERAQRRSELILSSAGEGIVGIDGEGNVTFANPAARTMLGWIDEELIGRNLHEAIHRNLPDDAQPTQADSPMFKTLRDGQPRHIKEDVFWRKDGSSFAVEFTVTAIVEHGHVNGAVNIFRDITERKVLEDRIKHMALFDSLTALPNRFFFEDALRRTASAAKRHGMAAAILYLDLDGFKPINDEFGHESGDVLLREVARRLRACVRTEDIVARLGGDEFVVVTLDAADTIAANSATLGRRIIEATGEPIPLQGREVHVSVSIGVSLFPSDSDRIEECVRAADAAMYRAKKAGRSRFIFAEARHPAEVAEGFSQATGS
ncbi:diguanylate cyclase domain-containing protein [Azospirillum sp. sgz301742]